MHRSVSAPSLEGGQCFQLMEIVQRGKQELNTIADLTLILLDRYDGILMDWATVSKNAALPSS